MDGVVSGDGTGVLTTSLAILIQLSSTFRR